MAKFLYDDDADIGINPTPCGQVPQIIGTTAGGEPVYGNPQLGQISPDERRNWMAVARNFLQLNDTTNLTFPSSGVSYVGFLDGNCDPRDAAAVDSVTVSVYELNAGSLSDTTDNVTAYNLTSFRLRQNQLVGLIYDGTTYWIVAVLSPASNHQAEIEGLVSGNITSSPGSAALTAGTGTAGPYNNSSDWAYADTANDNVTVNADGFVDIFFQAEAYATAITLSGSGPAILPVALSLIQNGSTTLEVALGQIVLYSATGTRPVTLCSRQTVALTSGGVFTLTGGLGSAVEGASAQTVAFSGGKILARPHGWGEVRNGSYWNGWS